MKPRESGGNVPGKKIKKKTTKANPAQAPAPPRTYGPVRKQAAGTAQLLPSLHGYSHLREKDEGNTKQQKAIKRDNYARAQFPYTNVTQVAYANAAGDVERNILSRATRPPTAPPKVHPGLNYSGKKPRAGYAYPGKNDIWLTPDAYLGKPNFTRGVALHEFAHTRQHLKGGEPKWAVEGGADYAAKGLAKKLGLPPYHPGYPKYLKSVERRVRLRKAK